MREVAVVALGGNALLKKSDKPSINNQIKNAKVAAKQILPLIKKYSVVVTHGNGPQVGAILLRSEKTKQTYPLPLDVCVAQSQGEIGYIIEQALRSVLPKKAIATVLSRTVVSKKDKAFRKPSKPIGAFYSSKKRFVREKIDYVYDSGRGYRRVVPSPVPITIVEREIIRNMLKKKIVVIAAGGGGIPVVKRKKEYEGVEAVIDKDLASCCLAKSLGAKQFFILTSVDAVYRSFGKKGQERIKKMNLKVAKQLYKEGEFAEGSMGPKIKSAIEFLESKGKRVIITSPKNLEKALRGKAGTIIKR